MENNKAIVAQETPGGNTAVITRPIEVVTQAGKELAGMIQVETEKRKLLTDYIARHMQEDIDYGRIHFSRTCQFAKNPAACQDPGHFTKPTLFKSGSEKFCSLLHLRPVFEYEFVDHTKGIYVFKCNLISEQDKIVGEGRGAAALEEKQGWTRNNAMKICEKRAQIDAVLRTGGLSDFFTQDLEDQTDVPPALPPAPKNGRQASKTSQQEPQAGLPAQEQGRPIVTRPNDPVSEPQKKAILAKLRNLGHDENTFFERAGKMVHELNKGEASMWIDRLKLAEEGKGAANGK